MKHILFLFVMALAIVSCSKNKVDSAKVGGGETTVQSKTAQKANQLAVQPGEQAEALPMTTISWDKTTHDFGDIKEGDIVETTFKITNNGDTPLVINRAQATCGCTVPQVEKNKPIAPGKTTEIKVRFNSSGKPNKQTKTVTLHGNFPQSEAKAVITAMVAPKPKPAGEAATTADDPHAGHNH